MAISKKLLERSRAMATGSAKSGGKKALGYDEVKKRIGGARSSSEVVGNSEAERAWEISAKANEAAWNEYMAQRAERAREQAARDIANSGVSLLPISRGVYEARRAGDAKVERKEYLDGIFSSRDEERMAELEARLSALPRPDGAKMVLDAGKRVQTGGKSLIPEHSGSDRVEGLMPSLPGDTASSEKDASLLMEEFLALRAKRSERERLEAESAGIGESVAMPGGEGIAFAAPMRDVRNGVGYAYEDAVREAQRAYIESEREKSEYRARVFTSVDEARMEEIRDRLAQIRREVGNKSPNNRNKGRADSEALSKNAEYRALSEEFAALSEKKATSPGRSASAYDLTVNAFKEGFLGSQYGYELSREMLGMDNDAERYEEMLSSGRYDFVPDNAFEKAVRGAANQVGQWVMPVTKPEVYGSMGAAATAALVAGNAGPQAALPEELVSVPRAMAKAYQLGAVAVTAQVEAGHAYKELIDAGISPRTASIVASVAGAGVGALEGLQLDELMKSFKVLSAVPGASSGKSTVSGVLKKVADYISGRAVSAAKEAGEEMLQEGVVIAGANIAGLIDKGSPLYGKSEAIDRILNTGADSFGTFALLGAAGDVTNAAMSVPYRISRGKTFDMAEVRRETAPLKEGALRGSDKSIGELIRMTDYENVLFERAKKNGDVTVQSLATSLEGGKVGDAEYDKKLGQLAKKLRVSSEDVISSYGRFFRGVYVSGIQDDGTTYLDYLEEEVYERGKVGDKLAVQALMREIEKEEKRAGSSSGSVADEDAGGASEVLERESAEEAEHEGEADGREEYVWNTGEDSDTDSGRDDTEDLYEDDEGEGRYGFYAEDPLLEDEDESLGDKGDELEDSAVVLERDEADYPYNVREVIEGYEGAVDKATVDYINSVRKMKDTKAISRRRFVVGSVSDRFKSDVKNITGVDFHGDKHVFKGDTVVHIDKRHGKNGKQDRSMSEIEDIARIGWVIENYDTMEVALDKKGNPDFDTESRNSDGTPSPKIKISKKINGTYYVVEAVPDSSAGSVFIKAAYISKKDSGKSSDGMLDMAHDTPQLTSAESNDSAPPDRYDKTTPIGSPSHWNSSTTEGSIPQDSGVVKGDSPGRTNQGTNQAEDKADGTVADKEADTEDFSDATDDVVMPDVAEESEASSGDEEYYELLGDEVPEGYFDEDSEVEIDEKQIHEEAVKDSAYIEAKGEAERARREYEKAHSEYVSAGGFHLRLDGSYKKRVDWARTREKVSEEKYRRLSPMAQRVDELYGELLNAQKREDEVYEQVRQRVLSELSGGQNNDGGFGGETRAALSGRRKADSFTEDKYYSRKIDKWDDLSDREYVVVGEIGESSVLAKVGVPDGRLYFDVSKIKKEMSKHADHLSTDILKAIPRLLDNPIVVSEYQPGSGSNTVSVYGELYSKGKPVVVGVVVTEGRGGNVISKIRTVHARGDLKNQITEDSILYLRKNKKEVNAWFQANIGINVPWGGTQLGVIRSINLDDSITHKDGFVKGEGKEKSGSGVTDSKKALAYDTSGDERLSFSEGNKNAAVENFATRMTGRFKAAGKNIKVEVFYDGSASALRGEWIRKDDRSTVIRLNGSLLRGSESASWVLCHELFHEGASADETLTLKVLYAFYKSGMYDESQFEAYREAYEEHCGEDLPEEFIAQEVAADLMYKAMGSRELLEMFAAKADGNVLKRLASGVSGIAKGIGGVLDGSRARRYLGGAYSVTEVFEEAVKGKEGARTVADKKTPFADDGITDESKKYSYDVLVANEPMKVVSVSANLPKTAEGKIDRKTIKANAMKNAFEVGEKVADDIALVKNGYSGKKIAVRSNAISHGLDRRTYVSIVSSKVGELLQNAIAVNEMSPRKNTSNINKSIIMIAMASDEMGNKYAVLLTVNDVEGRNPELVDLNVSEILYSINAKKEKSAVHSTRGPDAENAEQSLTDSAISIAEVLSFVKGYFSDVLSDDVLSHYGMQKSGNSDYENVRFALSNPITPETDAESKQRRESPMNRAIEAGAEEKFTYDALISLPDMVVPFIDSDTDIRFTADGRIDKAYIYGVVRSKCEAVTTKRKVPAYLVDVPALGGKVEVVGDGIKHGFNDGLKKNNKSVPAEITARAELMLPEILGSSVEVNRLISRGNIDVPYSSVLLGAVSIENEGKVEMYAVRSVVNVRNNQDPVLAEFGVIGSLYSSNAKKIDAPNGWGVDSDVARAHDASTTISISQLLDSVKGVFDDTLSEDVYSHFGMERKDSEFSKDLRYAISGKSVSDAESKQRRESPMNRAIEAGAQDLLGLAMTNEEYEEVAREVIESAEKTFGKDSPEAMLQAELTRVGRELRKVGRQIDGTMKAYKVKAFSVDEKKLDAFVERLCGVLEIDGKRSDVSSVREELYGLYILMEDYIAGSTSAEAVAAAARGISEDIIRLRKASELGDTEQFVENLASKFISCYLQVGKLSSKLAVPSLETLAKKSFACEAELEKVSESIPSESRTELAAKVRALRSEHEELTERYEAQKKKTAYSRLLSAQDEVYRKLSARIEQEKEKFSEYRRERRERKQRERLLFWIRRLRKMKTDNITREAIEELVGNYDALGISISNKGRIKLEALREEYEERLRDDPDFLADKDIKKKIDRLSRIQIGDLSIVEVEELIDEVLQIVHDIREGAYFFEKNKRIMIREMADSSVGAVIAGGGRDYVSDVKKFFSNRNLATLTPMSLFRKICGYDTSCGLYRAAEGLNEGQRRAMALCQDFSEAFSELVSDGRSLSDFTGKKAKAEAFTVRAIDYNNRDATYETVIHLTGAMKVSLYLSAKNEDFLRHAAHGGIRIPDAELMRKGRYKDAYAKGKHIILSPGQIHKITDTLTEYEKAWADRAWEFFNVKSKAAINEASMQLVGYEIANVVEYFPINVNRNYVVTEFESLVKNATLEGKGIFKERRPDARNPINLEDVTMVLERHINDVSAYAGLAVPIDNFRRLYSAVSYSNGGWSVKGIIEKLWGADVSEYIENVLRDLQTPREDPKGIHGFFSKLSSNQASALMMMNIPVTLGNYASLPQAAAVLGWDNIAAASVPSPSIKFDEEIVKKHTPLYHERKAGYTTRELGDIRSQHQLSKKNAFIEKAVGVMTAVDLDVSRRIWIASEYWVRKNRAGLEVGSDKYYRAVAEIFNKAIEETQANYSVMQRGEMLRSTNFFDKEATRFKSVMMQSFNILYDAVGEYHFAKKRGVGVEEARARVRRAVTSTIASFATEAILGSIGKILLTAAAAYRDDEERLTPASVVGEMLKRFGSSFLGMFPGATEVAEFGMSMLSKALEIFDVELPYDSQWYEMSASSYALLNNLGKRFENVLTSIDKATDGEAGASGIVKSVYKLAEVVSQMLGIPLANTVGAVWNLVGFSFEFFGGSYGFYLKQRLTGDTKSSVINSMVRAAYEVKKSGNEEGYEEIREDMLSRGYITEKRFKQKMSDFAKKDAFETEVREYRNGERVGRELSDAAIKEVFKKEIAAAAKVYASGDRKAAYEMADEFAQRNGMPKGRVRAIVVSAAG